MELFIEIIYWIACLALCAVTGWMLYGESIKERRDVRNAILRRVELHLQGWNWDHYNENPDETPEAEAVSGAINDVFRLRSNIRVIIN